MGRHSDSDEDRKKKKKSKHKSRSSSSDSITSKSSKHKKSKKSKHKKKSKSRSPSRRHKSKSPSRDRRRSRSRSVPKSYMIKSRSPSPYRSKRRSRSPSPYRSKRRSRSPSPYRSKRRSRSPSPYRSKKRSKSPSPYRSRRRSKSPSPYRSRTRRSRSRSRSPKRRSRSRSRDRSKRDRSRSQEKKLDAWDKLKSVAAAKAEAAKAEKEDPCANIPGFDLMTTSQQSEARLQMALKAAAAAGEKLKEQGVLPQSTSTSFLDQERRAAAIESIESDAFTPMAFKSSRGQGGSSNQSSHENAIFGLGDLTLTTTTSSELRAKDTESLMHPNLYISSEDKMQNWIEKLTRMRKRKLEGNAMFY